MTPRLKVPKDLQTSSPSGSPQSGEPAFLLIGRLRRPHGVHGEIVMEVLTDFPERIVAGKTLYCGEHYQPQAVDTVRKITEGLIIHFAGYATPEQVAELRNQWVYIPAADAVQLPAGSYYHHQLVGLKVLDRASGLEIGVLTEILETGADDVYVVSQPDGKELLIPAIESVVAAIDLSTQTMTINLQEWV